MSLKVVVAVGRIAEAVAVAGEGLVEVCSPQLVAGRQPDVVSLARVSGMADDCWVVLGESSGMVLVL